MPNHYWSDLVDEAYRASLRIMKAICDENMESIAQAAVELADIVQIMDVYIRITRKEREHMRHLHRAELMNYVYEMEGELRGRIQDEAAVDNFGE